MVRRNYMKEAIDVLEKYPSVQHSPLVVQILKDRPSTIVKAYESLNGVNKPWMEVVLNVLRSGRKIEAIKQLRALTDMGLKEAKEVVEELQEQHGISFGYKYP